MTLGFLQVGKGRAFGDLGLGDRSAASRPSFHELPGQTDGRMLQIPLGVLALLFFPSSGVQPPVSWTPFTSLAAGTYVSNRASDKIAPLSDNVFLCRSGSAADTQAVSDVSLAAISLPLAASRPGRPVAPCSTCGISPSSMPWS